MAFNFAAFLGGAAEQITTEIEETEKDNRTVLKNEFDTLQKKALEEKKNLVTKRDKLKSTAQVLSSYKGKNNVGFTEGQLVALLQNPAQAERVQKALTAAEGRLDQIDFNDIVVIAKGKTDKTVEQYIKEATTPVDTGAKIAPQEKKLFGFTVPGSATRFEREVQRQEKIKGATYGELKAQAAGAPELKPEMEVDVNLRSLAKPESVESIRGRLRDNLADGQSITGSAENTRMFNQLTNDAVLQATMKNKTEGDSAKPRTTASIRATFRDAIEGSVSPWILNGKLIVNKETGEYNLTSGTKEDIEEFVKVKNEVVQKTATQMGLTNKEGKIFGFKRDAEGNIVGGRDAYDALIRYANISYDGKVLGWKGMEGMPKPSASTGSATEGDKLLPNAGQPKQAPAAPQKPVQGQAPAKPPVQQQAAPTQAQPAPAAQQQSVMRQPQQKQPMGFKTPMGLAAGATPRPRNKAEYDAIPPGTRYFAQDGTLRVKK